MPPFLSTLFSSWSSRPWRDDFVPLHDRKLPLELWGIVVSFILDEIRHPYRYCTAATFPQYQIRFALATKIDKDSTLDNWKNVRLVCRTWMKFAGSPPHAAIKLTRFNNFVADKYDGISSISINLTATSFVPMRTFLLHPDINSKLTTIIFGADYWQDGADMLLDHPSAFYNVRCLSLPSAGTRKPFWQRLQDGYPQLVSLTIRYFVGDDTGYYTFKNLKILDINAWGNFRLSCPSLKHFSVRFGCTEPMAEFLKEHGHQFESLFLDRHTIKEATVRLNDVWMSREHIWVLFPNLQTLGVEVEMPISCPPPEHPLQNLRILSHRRSLTIEGLSSALETFPRIKSVHVCPTDIEPETMEDLRAQLAELNIEVVDVANLRVIPKAPIPSLLTAVAVLLTYPCWFPFLICSESE